MEPVLPDSVTEGLLLKRRCFRCGKKKPLAAFGRDRSRRQGRTYDCKQCRRHAHDPRIKHDRNLRQLYGITVDQYEALLEAQGGVCGICGDICATGRKLAVDHDHDTGLVRGLLCANCNIGVGYFKNNSRLLRKAIKYLDK